MSAVDLRAGVGPRALERLESEISIWLTTVSPGGRPQPTPVWFLWTGQELLVLSQPSARKLRNIAAGARVAVNFNFGGDGNDVQVLSGTARVDESGLSAAERTAYDTKYASGYRELQMSADAFHEEYSTLIRIGPERLTGWR
ncbi:TIGR03667 family PPOX class F420-dependent oxidoreductase [Luteipulveratus halotolerans]|uniref:Pyridoxamine 5'-phosphate oxidase N-terminal domain-containing protein n=1 Tax=Luteipulveratus halotolerans TaxID=1631356 RepID=A0A0L6CG74_9MICO|nr:TIGR03667 family PPOX class F420-dependent oxidoreductase [Luteipulveratus halotolerans]KNX36518.1 hypothetical protein VV01_04075 [Luteipulveratus halotolerans]